MRRNLLNITFTLLIVGILIQGGCGGGAREPGRYYADKHDFSIKFPDGWMVQADEQYGMIAALSPLEGEDDMFIEGVSVSVEQCLVSVDLEEYFNALNRTSESELAWFELESSEDVIIANTPAKRAVFSFVESGETVRSTGYCIVKGKKAYLIMCMSDENSYPAYAAEFDAISESFRFE